MANEDQNNNNNEDFQRGLLLDTKPKTKKPSMYNVLLLNDDYVESVPYAYDGLNKKLSGIRPKELVLLCGGSGTGKSQVTRELAYDLINKGHKIGYIALEESVMDTENTTLNGAMS